MTQRRDDASGSASPPLGRARPSERELERETAAALDRVSAALPALAEALRAGDSERALGHALALRTAARRVHALLAGDEVTGEWAKLEARIAEARATPPARVVPLDEARATRALDALARALEEDTEPPLPIDPRVRIDD